MFAISTAWNSNTHSDVKEMLSEIKEIGFNAIEVGFNFTAERLEELISLINVLGIKVVTIHNFCPVPSKRQFRRHISDYYRISSLDEDERKLAVEYTKRTIDTAQRLSAEAVIIHAGIVELNGNYVSALLRFYKEGRAGSKDYDELKQEFLKVREDKKDPYLDSATKSLEEILSYATKSRIKIGLENRYYPDEIPNCGEVEYFLKLFDNRGLFYWHDVGHAEANERLGIVPHLDFLKMFSDHMLGIHLHDIKGLEDHLAPFSGNFDFRKIAPYMKNGLIKVIEAHPKATPLQIKEGVVKLQKG